MGGKDIHAQIELSLTEQIGQDCAPGDRLRRASRGVQFVLVAAMLMIMGGFVVAPAQPNYVRIVLGSFPAFNPEAPPADLRMKSFSDRGAPGAGEARRLNAAIPFAGDAGVAARPFLSTTSLTDRDRAADCLAIAAMAEAGEGDDGQRAVIQVVLNRVRHPAFAKTVCGVVFEGSHRSTGCQFTFTCDGALARRYSAAAWSRARERAIDALNGLVYAPVSVATHYHTDWVHPYWSASLLKLTRVDTHLFFRWPGYRGSAASMGTSYRGGEPAIAQLAFLSAHADGARGLPLHDFDAGTQRSSASIDVVVGNADGGAFVLLAGAPSAEGARDTGRSLCGSRPSCKVFGWFDPQSIPAGYPVPASSRAKLGFSYFRSSESKETVLYDCSRFSNITNDKCLPPPARSWPKPQSDRVVEATVRNDRTMTIRGLTTELAGASLQ